MISGVGACAATPLEMMERETSLELIPQPWRGCALPAELFPRCEANVPVRGGVGQSSGWMSKADALGAPG